MIVLRRKLILALLISPAIGAQSLATAPRPMFFHGTITHVQGHTVTIFRRLVGHKPEVRSFIIRAGTSMNRRLAVNQDVTVRYLHSEHGDVAVDIRVHQRRPQSS